MAQLPGGLLEGGERHRDFAFLPMNGAVELALAESVWVGGSVPERVTALLAAALERVAGGAADRERVRRLCVADRQFLMRLLDERLGNGRLWLSHRCGVCAEPFDFPVQPTAMPFKPAGPGYPWAEVAEGEGLSRFRVPNGGDQEAVAGIADEREAALQLVRRCRVEGEEAGSQPDEARLARIEAALEEVAPELAVAVQVACPGCGAPATVPVDPYRVLGRVATGDGILLEIHQLALHYHWSEAEILALPRQRRLRYLELIDRARGLSR